MGIYEKCKYYWKSEKLQSYKMHVGVPFTIGSIFNDVLTV